jgi:hypothetical protein
MMSSTLTHGTEKLHRVESFSDIDLKSLDARQIHLRSRQSHYKKLLDRNRTDVDYCKELHDDLNDIEGVLLLIVNCLAAPTVSKYNSIADSDKDW